MILLSFEGWCCWLQWWCGVITKLHLSLNYAQMFWRSEFKLTCLTIHSHNIIKYKLGYALSSMQLYIKHIFSHFHTFFDSSNRKINPPSYLIFDLYIYFLICVVLLGTRLCWSQILFKKYINVFILFRSEWWTC